MCAKSFFQKINKSAYAILILMGVVSAANAKVSPAGCLTDNMVLQQKTDANLWGTATPNKQVSIKTSWNNVVYLTKADANGNWKQKVHTPSYGGPYTITFNDGEELTLKNILIGEVWVASGQSNMEYIMMDGNGGVNNKEQEVADAVNYPQIRMIKIDNKTSFLPRTDVQVKYGWNVCSPETAGQYSAVAYFFAKNLYQKNHVPIGIINSSWGGTVAETWVSGSALKTMPEFRPFVEAAEAGMNQDKLDEKYRGEVRVWIDNINKNDPAYKNGVLEWAQAGFNDSAWPKMNVPTYWEQAGVPDYDGTMWFRKKVNVPAKWAGKDLQLNIRGIDDYDVSFFNGTEVGYKELFVYPRNYTIPGNLVKAGENVIAIRVFDNGGLGGINNGPLKLQLMGDTTGQIDLAGQWAYQKAQPLTTLPQPPSNSNSPNRPTLIYNAMIAPILPYTIKGVIWYQGESNADRSIQYQTLFPLLINDWRAKWGEGNFPFYFVQIANYGARDQPPAADWPELRFAQFKTLSVPNTGMAVIIDIGEDGNIHPHNKQDVGRRLALWAEAKDYGEKVAYSGPLYQSQKIKGNKIEVSFTNTDAGLKAKGDTLQGFAIAGADKKFYWAHAVISGNKVVVSSADVANPVAVRYGWLNNPKCNLYNGADLPASPFKTDDWVGVRLDKQP